MIFRPSNDYRGSGEVTQVLRLEHSCDGVIDGRAVPAFGLSGLVPGAPHQIDLRHPGDFQITIPIATRRAVSAALASAIAAPAFSSSSSAEREGSHVQRRINEVAAQFDVAVENGLGLFDARSPT